MRLYEDTVYEFKKDVQANKLADKLATNFQTYYNREAGVREYRSWQQSLNFLKNSLEIAELVDNQIIIEYELPYSSCRIDAILFGNDINNKENVIVIELKQWSNENVYDCETEGNIIVNYGTFTKEQAHPSIQVQGYHYDLKDFLEIFSDENNSPELNSCVYAHNYSKFSEEPILFLSKFSEATESFPIYAKEDCEELGRFLKDKLSQGNGFEVFNRFTLSSIKPSKRLLDHTNKMINEQQMFNLIDDQIAAYNSIMHKAKKLSKIKDKSVVIVKGGPGTGKSVIALEVMGELLRQGKTVFHATGANAFTNTLRHIVGTRAGKLFKFFNSFTNVGSNSIDVLICDEAHRIRETSNSRYTKKIDRREIPQIEELIDISKLSIYFLDENQVVRPNEIGSVDLIKKTAKKLGIKEENIAEFELKTQFRCSGSDAYLQWIDDTLDISESDLSSYDHKMEFRIFDDLNEMMNEIRQRNSEKKNSARITAGFCWPWSPPNRDGTLVNDVVIGSFKMPWENKGSFWKWATDDSGMEQVGTVYTAQGFEFDYIGVIFGKDLIYNPKSSSWEAHPENSYDTQVKRNNPELVKHFKNVYRTLLSRAHKGVYIYFMDKDTENHFRNNIFY